MLEKYLNDFKPETISVPNENRYMEPDRVNCYPNPFDEKMTISFTLEERSKISVVIFDVAGRQIHLLTDEILNQGIHDLEWDGKNNRQEELSPGIYFCMVQGSSFLVIKRIILLNRQAENHTSLGSWCPAKSHLFQPYAA